MERDPLLRQMTPLFKFYKEKSLISRPSEDAALLFLSSVKGLFYVCLADNRDEEKIRALISHYVHTFCHGVAI